MLPKSHVLDRVAVVVGLGLALGLTSLPAQGQSLTITVPNVSQHARTAQTIGITEIEVAYHRPLVRERSIWGGVVPYDQVWRAGANENTTISFSTPVRILGKDLGAGAYGLHMIPKEQSWEIIFSKFHESWGSYSYKEDEDALRVSVEPEVAPFQEALTYSFDDPAAKSVTLALSWAELRVPIVIDVDTPSLVLANGRNQLRGLMGFFWQGSHSAAQYALQEGIALDEALGWIEQSLQIERNFSNLTTKAGLVTALGRDAEAGPLVEEAIGLGQARELYNFGRTMLGQGKTDLATRVFAVNAERHPETWFVHLGVARGQSANGDLEGAAKSLEKAKSLAPEAQIGYLDGLIQGLVAGKPI